jgi:hypothetical protein
MKKPLPGYGIATIDKSQFSNVDYEGEDRWDTPQSGKLISIHPEDTAKQVREDSDVTFGGLLQKKIFWKKYADADGTFPEGDYDVIFLDLTKITGFDDEE